MIDIKGFPDVKIILAKETNVKFKVTLKIMDF